MPSVVSALAKRGLAKRDWRNAMQPPSTERRWRPRYDLMNDKGTRPKPLRFTV